LYYYQIVTALLVWGGLSNKRTGLSFTIFMSSAREEEVGGG
jgi:hypothetical protein